MKYQGRILELMNEMQSYGSPPSEIMGEMPPGIVSVESDVYSN